MLPAQTMSNQCVNDQKEQSRFSRMSLVPAARFSTVFRKTLIVRKLEVSLSPAACWTEISAAFGEPYRC